MSAGSLHCSYANSANECHSVCILYIKAEAHKETQQTHHLFQRVINILCQHSYAHTAPLQPHPPLPCTYSSSPVVNCIPLDDITGNKRQQQDNKRSELQPTSFISDFITPPLMDVDLYTLLHLTCSVRLPLPPSLPSSLLNLLSHFLSLFPFLSVIYIPVSNTSP